MPDADQKADLDALGARLAAAQAKHTPPREVAQRALASGTRYAVEIAVATMVGFAIGWQLDSWFGTKPWMAILFLMLGLAAGFTNLMRAVNREAAAVKADQAAAQAQRQEGE
ncbi:AtpZ/AtpI family protein [Sandaracinobacteroides saxicola]|uniref:AtpZ/AtpI family protein n=1 Tax=Sandaracinobacteroides saxicola TaxID=2759707 RepID=UPI001A9C7ECD|nr:AtpZ/AtpI family protein [Sandaracinobacteroides saxicola]